MGMEGIEQPLPLNLGVEGIKAPSNEPIVQKKSFSWEEIGRHRSPKDCWIVVRGRVYDVSSWVPLHPGGKLILNGAGREATALFVSYHPLRVQQMLHKYEIGEVEEYHPYYRWDESDFYPVLKRRVESFMDEKRLQNGAFVMYFKTLIILVAWITSWYFSMVKGNFLFAVSMGFWQSHFGINIAHDGNHGAYSKSKFINSLAARTMDFIGASSIVWVHQHNVGHHPNSNREGDSFQSECDPDTRSGNPIIRIAPKQPLLWHHQWQHIYVWGLYCFVTFKWYLNDIKSFLRKKYVSIDFFEIGKEEIAILAVAKFVFATYMFFVPLYFHPLWKALLLTFIVMAVKSYCFVLMFSVNHLTQKSLFPDESVNDRDWATLQVLTASNFAVGSSLWTWLSGGLNYQIEHHLFPYVCHVYLPKISPIVQQTCREYGIPYAQFPTFWEAFRSHYEHLRNLGNPGKTD